MGFCKGYTGYVQKRLWISLDYFIRLVVSFVLVNFSLAVQF